MKQVSLKILLLLVFTLTLVLVASGDASSYQIPEDVVNAIQAGKEAKVYIVGMEGMPVVA